MEDEISKALPDGENESSSVADAIRDALSEKRGILSKPIVSRIAEAAKISRHPKGKIGAVISSTDALRDAFQEAKQLRDSRKGSYLSRAAIASSPSFFESIRAKLKKEQRDPFAKFPSPIVRAALPPKTPPMYASCSIALMKSTVHTMTAEEMESRMEKLRSYDFSCGGNDSFFSRVWSDLFDTSYVRNFTFRGIGGSLAGMRRATSIVEEIAGIAERNAQESKLPKKGGISSLLQYWKTYRGYRRDVRQLRRCTTELSDLIDKEFEAAFPHEKSSVFEYIESIEKALTSAAKKEQSAAKGEEKKEEKKSEKDDTAKAEQQPTTQKSETGKSEESAGAKEESQTTSAEAPAQPTQSAASPIPPPQPPKKPDDPKDEVALSPKGQIKATKILQNFTHSLANIEVNINVNISIFANESGKVNWTESEAADIKNKARLALQDFIGSGNTRQTVDLSPESKSSVAEMSAQMTTAKLRAENLVKPRKSFFAYPKKMTKKQKQRHDIQVIRAIHSRDSNTTPFDSIGIEEAARRAQNAGLLIGYVNGHSASVSYRRIMNDSTKTNWLNFCSCSPNEVEEIIAELDKREAEN